MDKGRRFTTSRCRQMDNRRHTNGPLLAADDYSVVVIVVSRMALKLHPFVDERETRYPRSIFAFQGFLSHRRPQSFPT